MFHDLVSRPTNLHKEFETFLTFATYEPLRILSIILRDTKQL